MALRGPPDERSVEELLAFGVINLDKPAGPSAHQVAGWVRDMAGVGKAAHAGTLDPKVTGCLPTLLGTATRAAPALQRVAKTYIAVLELHAPVPADFEAVLGEFEGELYQKPPRKSAVSRRLRTRELHELTALETEDRRALLRIRCESGTYIRKVCHDLGLALGTGAHMGDLRRAETGPFDDRTLVTLHDFADALAADHDGPLREVVSPAERAIQLPEVVVAPSAAEQIAEGAPVYAPGVIEGPDVEEGLVACYTPNGAVVCLGELVGDPDAASGKVVSLTSVLV